MKHYTLNMILYWLGDSVRDVWPGMKTLQYRDGICLLDEAEPHLDSVSLYVGTPDTFLTLLAAGAVPEEGAFVLTCKGEAIPTPLPKNLTLVQTNLSFIALYNRVHTYVHRYARWTERLQQAVYENAGFQELLNIAAEEIHATIMITNPGYKYIAAYYHPNITDETTRELQEIGYHTYEVIQRIHSEKAVRATPDRSVVEYISSVSNNYNIVHLIRYRDALVARMCVMLQGPAPNPCYRDLAAVLAEYVSQAMLSGQGADYNSNAALGSLVADLIECRLTDPDELDQRLKQVQLAVRKYYHPVLVRINQTEDRGLIPWNYIMSQLQHAFRYCDATTYRGDILLLARKTSRGSRPSFKQELLQQILEQYDGRAVIGNASEYLPSLAPIYHQIRGAMHLGTRMDPDKRIYFYEDYSMYQIIEMAAEAEQHHLSSRNLAHLCNNEMIALMLYDKKHGTNLIEILHTYLTCERNTTEAARALYLHRNTMIYKVKKIEEVIGSTLDDPNLRERLLFSYRVLTYMDKYLGDDILKLKRATPQDAAKNAANP